MDVTYEKEMLTQINTLLKEAYQACSELEEKQMLCIPSKILKKRPSLYAIRSCHAWMHYESLAMS